MKGVSETMKQLIEEQGRRQKWVVARMNEINPNLNMNDTKLSAVLLDKRSLSADELLAFCMALEVSPDVFCKSA